MQDEDSEETGEDVTRDNSWNYADILWNGIRADAVQSAFDKLSFKEQTYLEKRNAICMTCGRAAHGRNAPPLKNWRSCLRAAQPAVRSEPIRKLWTS